MSNPLDILVVGAHPPDLIGLRDHLGQRLDGMVFGMHVAAKVSGIGMGVAGAWTAKRVFQLLPRAVILVGSAGVYPGLPTFQPLDVLVATELKLIDHGVLNQQAAYPGPMQVQVSAPGALSSGLLGDGAGRVRAGVVGSPLAQTTSDHLAAAVPGATGCTAECLEAFAIAQACQIASIPFGVVLGISHVVGSHAQQDWQRYQRDAARAAATTVLNWLHAGAPGLPHR